MGVETYFELKINHTCTQLLSKVVIKPETGRNVSLKLGFRVFFHFPYIPHTQESLTYRRQDLTKAVILYQHW